MKKNCTTPTLIYTTNHTRTTRKTTEHYTLKIRKTKLSRNTKKITQNLITISIKTDKYQKNT